MTTLASPHHGFRLLQISLNELEDAVQVEHFDKPLEVVGMSRKNAVEFFRGNMKAFNEVVENQPGVEYFSLGARKDTNL